MNIRNFFKRFFNKDCSVLLGDTVTFDPSDYMVDITRKSAYMLPLSKKINACQNITMAVYKKSKDGKVLLEKHPLNMLFEMINPNTSFQDFLDYLIVWLEGSDNGVLLELVRGLPGMKPDIYVYSPSNFTVYYEGRSIREIRINSPVRSITGDELKNYMWLRNPNYNAVIDGVTDTGIGTGYSKHNAIAMFGAYSEKAWLWNWSLAKNLGKPGGILQTDGVVDKDDREEIRTKYASQVAGANNAGKPVVLGSGLKYQDTSRAPIDADWSVAEQKAYERAAIGANVPAELVGGGESTYQNRKQAKKELYREAVIPFFNRLKTWLNYLLKDYLKPGEFIDYDLSGADELKEDLGDVIQKLDSIKDRITVNEYRKIISKLTDFELDAVPGGDVLLVSGGESTLEEITTNLDVDGERAEDV